MHELKELVINFCEPLVNWFASLGELGLFLLAFIESSFFPIPPDLLYITLILKGATNPYALALIATVGSTLGAVFGYGIGYFGGRPIVLKMLGSKIEPALAKAEKFFEDYGSLAMFIAAFTPVPFKVFTVTGGLCKMNLTGFIVYSFFGRAGRFFLFTYLFVNYGQAIMDNFIQITIGIGLIAFVAYFVWKFFTLKRKKLHHGK
jgi:membrane protein YqaA with SNARE-associated domain